MTAPTWEVREGDCVAVLTTLDAESIDAVVTDPPYGLEFMGKDWDRLWVNHPEGQDGRIDGRGGMDTFPRAPQYKAGLAAQLWHEAWAREAYRVMKPGAHLLAFSSTRTYHRMACAVEDAGFEIRDQIGWCYGSGFPKSLDIGKAMDAAAGAEREVIGQQRNWGASTAADGKVGYQDFAGEWNISVPATDLARQWDGWGTALKPAWEPIVVARKPLRGTVAANVARFGTGGLNVDATRIAGDVPQVTQGADHGLAVFGNGAGLRAEPSLSNPHTLGRWPANLVLGCACDGEHDPSCSVAVLDAQSGERRSAGDYPSDSTGSNGVTFGIPGKQGQLYNDTGGASRFYYTAKASREERERGLEALERHDARKTVNREPGSAGALNPRAGAGGRTLRRNHHPTVKPVDLMQWLVRLVTPPGGLVLDPFVGSGTTGIAAMREGFRFLGIDQDAEYCDIARARIVGDSPMFNGPAMAAGV